MLRLDGQREELGDLAERDQTQRPGGLHGAGAHGNLEPECHPDRGERDVHGDATAAGALSVLAGPLVADVKELPCRHQCPVCERYRPEGLELVGER